MQRVFKVDGGEVRDLSLPDPADDVIPGVVWGRFDEFFTPAFWKARLWIDGERSALANYTIGRSLREEVAACILGGYGMPAEVGLAAFERLRHRGLLRPTSSPRMIELALREPLAVGERMMKYRYPKIKSHFLSTAMKRMENASVSSLSPVSLRDWLMTFPGIGPKTASWITRNFTHSDDVAILDLHVIRAGVLMGLFPQTSKVPRDYLRMEERLVSFARGLGVQLSKFDSVIWCYMRQLNSMAIDALRAGSGPQLTADPA